MKKVVCAVFALALMSGCGSKAETKTMTCKLDAAANGVSTVISVDYEYVDDTVSKQIQKSVIAAETDDLFEQLDKKLTSLNYTGKLKGMDGVTYELLSDKDKKEVVENLTVDFTKVSADDYKVVTNGQVDTKGKKLLVSLKNTEDNMKKGGYTCTK